MHSCATIINLVIPIISDFLARNLKIMSRVCQLTGKKANNAYAISHSHRRTKKLQEVNLQWKRVWWPEGQRWVRLRLSTKAIKTLERKGLTAFAKEAGLNLSKL